MTIYLRPGRYQLGDFSSLASNHDSTIGARRDLLGDLQAGESYDAREAYRHGRSSYDCLCGDVHWKRTCGNPHHDCQHIAGRVGHRRTSKAAPRARRGDQNQPEQNSEGREHFDWRISVDWTGISRYLRREDHFRAGYEGCGDTELWPPRTSWTGGSSWTGGPDRTAWAQGGLEANCHPRTGGDQLLKSLSKSQQQPSRRFSVSLLDQDETSWKRDDTSRATLILWFPLTAVPMRHAVRPSAARAIPAAAVPPIISMPMLISPVGTGDGSGRSSYGSTATTADGTTDDRTPKRALSIRFAGREHSCEREQNDEQCQLSHLGVPFLIDRIWPAVPPNGFSPDGHQRRAERHSADTNVASNASIGTARCMPTSLDGGKYTGDAMAIPPVKALARHRGVY